MGRFRDARGVDMDAAFWWAGAVLSVGNVFSDASFSSARSPIRIGRLSHPTRPCGTRSNLTKRRQRQPPRPRLAARRRRSRVGQAAYSNR